MAVTSRSSQGRQSWRESNQRGSAGGSTAGRHAKRWFFSLLAVLMMIGLVVLMMQGCRPVPNTHFAALEIPYEVGIAAPRLVAASEAGTLGEMLKGLTTNVKVADPSVWKALRESNSTSRLPENLRQMPIASEDTLVLYVSAHGITHQGEAYILASDFTLDSLSRDSGRYSVKELLQAVANTPARTKLVLLDWGRIQFDPRLGIVYNDFPEEIATVLKDVADPGLWVMLSHVDVAPPTILSERWTLFAAALAEGLAGGADRPPADRRVDLKELYSYVAARYATWFGNDSYTPKPGLLRGGQGQVPNLDDAAKLFIVAVKDQPPNVEKDKDGKELPSQQDVATSRIGDSLRRQILTQFNAQSSVNEGRTLLSRGNRLLRQLRYFTADDSPPQADAASEEGAGDEPPTAEGGDAKPQPEDGEAPAPKPPAPTDRIARLLADSPAPPKIEGKPLERLALLHAAWDLRDQLHQRRLQGGWSPVDFAPHAWRHLNADLLALEQELLSFGLEPSTYFDDDVAQVLEDLERLAVAITDGATARDTRGLVAAWQSFRSSAAYADFTATDPTLTAAAATAKTLNSALFEGRWYLRWVAAESATSTIPLHRSEVRDLLQSARELKLAYDQLVGQPASSSAVQNLNQLGRQLQQRQESLRELLAGDLDRAIPEDFQPDERAVTERHMTTLLSTPLLTADQRLPLIARLLVPVGEYRDINESWSEAKSATFDTRPRFEISCELAELEDLLSSIEHSAGLGPSPRPATAEELQKLAEQLSEWEGRLSHAPGYYARLLADPRDQTGEQQHAELGILPPRRVPALGLEVVSAEPLAMNQWSTVTLRVNGDGEPLRQVAAVVQFDGERLSVVTDEGQSDGSAASSTAGIDNPLRFTIRQPQQTTYEWTLRVMPRARATVDVRETDLHVELTASGLVRLDKRIPLSLPLPESRVRLLVQREGSREPETQFVDGASVRPFPNRVTGFQFYLTNPSLEARKIQVELYAAPKVSELKRAPGRFFQEEVLDGVLREKLLDGQGRLHDYIRREQVPLGTAAPVTVAAGARQRIELQRAAPPAPAAAEGTPPPPAPALPPLDRDVTHGLLALLTDVDRPDQQWIEWLEINPLRPSAYLRASAVYDDKEHIAVTLEPLGLPVDVDSKPINIWLEAVEGISPTADRMANVKMVSATPATVWVAAPPDGARRRVRVHVDGVPRAFEFEVPCQLNGRGDNERIRKLSVHIDKLTPRKDPAPGTEAAAPTEPPPAYAASSDPNAPTLLRACDHILLDLQVDAPEAVFDFIEVTAADRAPQLFYADRLEKTQLVGEGSALLLKTEVRDLQIDLFARGRLGRWSVKVRGYDSGLNPPTTVRDVERTAHLLLDDAHPIISYVRLSSSSVPKNGRLQVTATADDGNDGSGIAEIYVGIDADNSGALEEKEKVLLGARDSAELDIQELRENRRYAVLVQAQDRVGLQSRVERREVIIRPPVVERPKPMATKANVSGTVVFRDAGPVSAALVTVELQGSGKPPQATGSGGRFQFSDVPLGKYKLVASGSFQNKPCAGEMEIEVRKDETVVLTVDRKKPQ